MKKKSAKLLKRKVAWKNRKLNSTARPALAKPIKKSVSNAAPTMITVLQAIGSSTRKEFHLKADGGLRVVPFGTAYKFNWSCTSIGNIRDLSALVERLSKLSNAILIRGTPVGVQPQPTIRRKARFPESAAGCPWVMLDFDGIKLPEGVSPIDPAAIEYLVKKLPLAFHGVSYYYQFSSSAGILKPDGTALKQGVSAHVFFYLDRPVPGVDLIGYLRLHCIQTRFYERKLDKGGTPRIVYGVDESVIRSSVQPHYVAWPYIDVGVRCVMPPELRQGLIEKSSDSVDLSDLNDNVIALASKQHRELNNAWKKENGFEVATSLTKALNGSVSADTYYRNPNPAATRTGRTFVRAEVTTDVGANGKPVQYARLYFDDEGTPGSWRVFDFRPTLAQRHGDQQSEHLRELSPGAYDYVRDELKWFQEVVQLDLSLLDTGYLPAFADFVNSRYSLILAPTGSGKTTAFCNWAYAERTTTVFVYAAQTIALTKQMEQDLRRRGAPVVHYESFDSFTDMRPGVYVTTNASLWKFIDKIKRQGKAFKLVIDEAHAALDDFMARESKNKLFEEAIQLATSTIFMTGTMTVLQRQKLSDTVARNGGLARTNFTIYEFAPVMSFPLRWAKLSNFGRDLVALLRSYQSMKARGEVIPRTVLIAPTSAMKRFRLVLAHFGLTDEAMVVSRHESMKADIEAARTSSKPLLITSPLFALGLNFDHAPVRFWTSFENLEVDTSQIIQTLNRANRTVLPCEVRLYAGKLDSEPYKYMNEERERDRLHEFLLDESDVPGEIDLHFQLDRVTYNELRSGQEKDTVKALYQLHRDNSIQNYRIVEDWVDDLAHEEGDDELFRGLKKTARQSYKDDVSIRVPKYSGQNQAILAAQLEKQRELRRDFRNKELVPKTVADEERAILAAMTGNPEHVSKSKAPNPTLMRRLQADLTPYLGSQFSSEKTGAWREASAGKVKEILNVFELIGQLRAGQINGVQFGHKMRQKMPKRGVLALVTGDADYIAWQKRFEMLNRNHERYSNAAVSERKRIDAIFFKEAQAFLGRIGVTFEKTKGADGRYRIDSTKPNVPASWEIARMRVALEIKAESLKNMPREPVKSDLEALKWGGAAVGLELCRTCVHCDLDNLCEVGRPIQAVWDTIEPTQDSCDRFVKLSSRVRRLKVELGQPENSEIFWFGKASKPEPPLDG